VSDLKKATDGLLLSRARVWKAAAKRWREAYVWEWNNNLDVSRGFDLLRKENAELRENYKVAYADGQQAAWSEQGDECRRLEKENAELKISQEWEVEQRYLAEKEAKELRQKLLDEMRRNEVLFYQLDALKTTGDER